jgi:hypothetical protein
MKKVLQVNDEGYSMFTILVEEEGVEALSKLIQELHDGFYEDFDIQDEYGGYYEYVFDKLSEMKDIVLLPEPEVLDL